MCLGISVQRDETAIDGPASGFKILEVSNTTLSFNSFLDGINKQKIQMKFG